MEWILLAIFAGVCNGAFALPMKFATKWNWENIWGTFIFWGFIVFPLLLAGVTIPGLWTVFAGVGVSGLFGIFGFGFLWGIGSICFGLGIRYIGIGLAFSINIGITIAVGSLLPLLREGVISNAASDSVRLVILGVAVIIGGVIINGYAGALREKRQTGGAVSASSTRKTAVPVGVLLCVCAGLFSPMLQASFMYGSRLLQVAAEQGIEATTASNAIWVIALAGGFVVNSIYVLWLLFRNHSFKLFAKGAAKRNHLLGLVMGFLWVVTIACYGMAVSNMGDLGLSVGWAIFNSLGIITANVLGLFTGEWRLANRKTLQVLAVGLIILVLGTCMVAIAE